LGGAETVTVKRAGKELKLKKGEGLELGDEVYTNRTTAVDIRLADKTLIRVGANSVYKLEGESQNLLHRLLSGIVRVLVPPSNEAKTGSVRFQLNTPEGTIGVRGTEFVVIAAKGLTTLKGLEGEVLFGALGADFGKAEGYVAVKQGFQSSVATGGKADAPKAFPLPAYLKEIDGRGGVFGALAARTGTPVKTRSAVAPPAGRAKPAVVASLKSRVIDKAKAPTKAKEEENPDQMLFFAASAGNMNQAKEALKKGADVNSKHIDGNTALHVAAVEAKYDMMKFLVDNQADVNAKNNYGYTPLMVVAFETGDAKAAFLLVESKARVGEKDSHGVTALDLAKSGHKKDKEGWQDILDYLTDESAK
jgi:hypothetical protein